MRYACGQTFILNLLEMEKHFVCSQAQQTSRTLRKWLWSFSILFFSSFFSRHAIDMRAKNHQQHQSARKKSQSRGKENIIAAKEKQTNIFTDKRDRNAVERKHSVWHKNSLHLRIHLYRFIYKYVIRNARMTSKRTYTHRYIHSNRMMSGEWAPERTFQNPFSNIDKRKQPWVSEVVAATCRARERKKVMWKTNLQINLNSIPLNRMCAECVLLFEAVI